MLIVINNMGQAITTKVTIVNETGSNLHLTSYTKYCGIWETEPQFLIPGNSTAHAVHRKTDPTIGLYGSSGVLEFQITTAPQQDGNTFVAAWDNPFKKGSKNSCGAQFGENINQLEYLNKSVEWSSVPH
jgi:hypothetical protein